MSSPRRREAHICPAAANRPPPPRPGRSLTCLIWSASSISSDTDRRPQRASSWFSDSCRQRRLHRPVSGSRIDCRRSDSHRRRLPSAHDRCSAAASAMAMRGRGASRSRPETRSRAARLAPRAGCRRYWRWPAADRRAIVARASARAVVAQRVHAMRNASCRDATPSIVPAPAPVRCAPRPRPRQ